MMRALRITLLGVLAVFYVAGLVDGQQVPSKPQPNRPTRPIPRAMVGYYYPRGPHGPAVKLPIVAGNNTRVRVKAEPRLPWTFPLAPELLLSAPRSATVDHASLSTTYQLWVPASYRHRTPGPLVLYVSSKETPDEFFIWDLVCHKHKAMFAVAHGGGELAHPAKRMRLTLDMFDDLRRRMAIDTDRVYVAGEGAGARTACDLAFAYPEYVGGVLAIGGSSPLRSEPYLRDRAKERLSVVLMADVRDPAYREQAAFRYPVLRDSQVRTLLRPLTPPGPGQTQADPILAGLEDALLWLEAKYLERRALCNKYQTLRIREGVVPQPEAWAAGLLEEAVARMKVAKERESGVLLLEGIVGRWPETEAARAAKRRLAEQKDDWRKLLDRRQQDDFQREAKAFDDYAFVHGVVDKTLLRQAIELWTRVEKAGPTTKMGNEAKQRLAVLRREL